MPKNYLARGVPTRQDTVETVSFIRLIRYTQLKQGVNGRRLDVLDKIRQARSGSRTIHSRSSRRFRPINTLL
jgi:hypothetical protein